MIKTSFREIATQLGLPAPQRNVSFEGISIDSRTLIPGNLFIAIKGDNFDGHDFLSEAEKKGAAAALVSHEVNASLPQLIVDDTLIAFGHIAAHWRNQFSCPVIGVTGSNGKTTLKNMLAAILRAACNNQPNAVLATEGNLNNNIGLPLNLIRLNTQHQYAVLEMGMNHFGEIAYLTKLAKPSVAIITNAGAAHLEGVKDIAGVARAKGEIFLGLDANGTAILNHDDAYFNYWRECIGERKYLTFGLEQSADITANTASLPTIIIKTPQGQLTVDMPLLGQHNVMNALAATAAAMALQIDLTAIKQGLENMHPAPGRMKQYHLANKITVIDDTYNANPLSLQAAVNTLAMLRGKKILVLGDMKELGSEAKALHFLAGKNSCAAGIDLLFTLGELSAATAEGFGSNAHSFTDRDQLVAALLPHLTDTTTVLIKGSRSMQMEKVVAKLIPAGQLEPAH